MGTNAERLSQRNEVCPTKNTVLFNFVLQFFFTYFFRKDTFGTKLDCLLAVTTASGHTRHPTQK